MNVSNVIQLPAPVPVHAAPLVQVRPAGVPAPAAPQGSNLSLQAVQTYQVVSAGAAYPPSSTPTFVLPANSRGFMQLYNALQAIAVERVYPAPIFSFSA